MLITYGLMKTGRAHVHILYVHIMNTVQDTHIIVEGLGFAAVIACGPPLGGGTVQVPENAVEHFSEGDQAEKTDNNFTYHHQE